MFESCLIKSHEYSAMGELKFPAESKQKGHTDLPLQVAFPLEN